MTEELYIKRCLDLAKIGEASASPNPSVGAVLVFENKIIGEGFTSPYGGPHGEVNCINSVQKENYLNISKSTLYVSLEPCSHWGKTPPCVDLILKNNIQQVVICCKDPFEKVNGNGIAILLQQKVSVKVSVLEKYGHEIVKKFLKKNIQKKPFVTLKFAKSKDGFIGQQNEQIWLSNAISKTMVHKLRSESDAILIGTKTAILDNPRLDTRLYFGKNPLRIVLDKTLKIPKTHHLHSDNQCTIFITEIENTIDADFKKYKKIDFDNNLISNLLDYLYTLNINSVLVEGGGETISHFIDQKLWDEAIVIETEKMLYEGIVAPTIIEKSIENFEILDNTVKFFRKGC